MELLTFYLPYIFVHPIWINWCTYLFLPQKSIRGPPHYKLIHTHFRSDTAPLRLFIPMQIKCKARVPHPYFDLATLYTGKSDCLSFGTTVYQDHFLSYIAPKNLVDTFDNVVPHIFSSVIRIQERRKNKLNQLKWKKLKGCIFLQSSDCSSLYQGCLSLACGVLPYSKLQSFRDCCLTLFTVLFS